jgi:hypothetical protein
MEAPEVPLEQVQDDIQEHAAAHGHGAHATETPWTRWIALSTALIAALAALASLAAGHTETESMLAKMEANDRWGYMNSVSLKLHQSEDTERILAAVDKEAGVATDLGSRNEERKHEDDKRKQEELASASERASVLYLKSHESYGYGVTLFQVAIALSAISALTRRRRYWLISLGLGGIGVAFALGGLATQAGIVAPEAAAETAAPTAAGALPSH